VTRVVNNRLVNHSVQVLKRKNMKGKLLLSSIGKTFEEKATTIRDEVIAKVLADSVCVVSGIPAHNPVTMATPGSKSISNRALVLAALGKGTCRLKNLLHSDDTQVMMAALLELKVAKPCILHAPMLKQWRTGCRIHLGRWW
jgi:hypothetical protein